jgi:hypothetical protein
LPRVEDALTLHVPPESGKDLEEPAPAPAESIFPLRVAFYGSPPDLVVEVERLGCVRHGPARVVHDLKLRTAVRKSATVAAG